MGDDFANEWGASYILIDCNHQATKRRAIDYSCSSDRVAETELRSIIHQCTRGFFSLEKLTPNGSDANLFAITSLSNGDTNGVLVGCGSYISGDLGPLQCWSTANFRIEEGPTYIYSPQSQDVSTSGRNRTTPLPYHLPGIMKERRLESYEDLCLRILHKRCVYQKTIDQPITVLFLELLLASNGSVLSDRFLEKLGNLSIHHGFGIIVDEILTGARTEEVLLTMEKPRRFLDQVTYITVGKWCKCGMILTGNKRDIYLERKNKSLDARGVTTTIKCSVPLPYFRVLQELKHNSPTPPKMHF